MTEETPMYAAVAGGPRFVPMDGRDGLDGPREVACSRLRIPMGAPPDFVEVSMTFHEDRGWPGDPAAQYVPRRLSVGELREFAERLYLATRRGRPIVLDAAGRPWEPDPHQEVGG